MYDVPADLLGLEDHVALITGGGAGIGRAYALQLARAGCHIGVADIDFSAAESVAEEVRALGRKATAIHVDVRSAEQIAGMVDTVCSELGRLDVAVNNIGATLTISSFLDMTEEEWDANQALNLKSTFLCCQREAIAMIERGIKGRIINVASSSGVTGAPTVSSYGAAKAGVIHFTKSVALELSDYGVRVNCIIPGTHMTEKIRATLDANGPQAEFLTLAGKAMPLGRLGDPMETGGLAVFLASNLSSYMTGHAVISDGGITHTTQRPPVGGQSHPKALEHVDSLS